MTELDVSKLNVRQRELAEDLDELADSLDRWGLLQPIVVRPKPNSGFEILVGQRRYLAAKRLGWDTIDARVVTNPISDVEASIISFAENAQRRDITPRDKSEACTFLLKQLGSVREVAHELGISETTVRRWLGYAAVPEAVKQLVEEGRISRPTATRISENVADAGRATEIARRIAELDPAGEERKRLLDAVEEHGDRPTEFIVQRAKERQTRRLIQFDLPTHWTDVLVRAEQQLDREAAEIARDATIEWLQRFVSLANTPS